MNNGGEFVNILDLVFFFKIYEDSEGVVLVDVEVKVIFSDGKLEVKVGGVVGGVVGEWLERVLFLLFLLLYVLFGELYFLEKFVV